MGLDMYLTRKIYVGAEYEHRKVTGNISLSIMGEPVNIDLNKISEIKECVGYWRKSNAIHRWFVENVQSGNDDCGDYEVSKDDMEKLLNLVNLVLAENEKANELLPCQAGFFFGGTEYNEYYFSDLKDTKEILESALTKIDKQSDYYYHSSW